MLRDGVFKEVITLKLRPLGWALVQYEKGILGIQRKIHRGRAQHLHMKERGLGRNQTYQQLRLGLLDSKLRK